MKTRAKKGSAAGKTTDDKGSAKPVAPTLEPSVALPPQILVLPEDTSVEARIATAALNRYLVCPERGFYEFTRVAAPKRQCRSWLLAPKRRAKVVEPAAVPGPADEVMEGVEQEQKDEAGYVLQTPDLLVATPIDPLFLLIPALAGDSEHAAQEYLAPSDYLTKLTEASPHFSQMIQPTALGKLESMLTSRIKTVCDCMDMGDEKMYALSLPKLAQELVSKATRMTARGLPASMEARFVQQALEVPVLGIKREESSVSIVTEDAAPGAESQISSEALSQESGASGATAASIATVTTSVSSTSQPVASDKGEIAALLRLRTALDFLLSSYILPRLHSRLNTLFAECTDWTSLEAHLAHLVSLRKQAQALRSLSDNISRKRAADVDDDEDAAGKADAKRRKKEEDELKKKNVSHGVKKLAKADTSGMKKLSSFFNKGAPVKAKK